VAERELEVRRRHVVVELDRALECTDGVPDLAQVVVRRAQVEVRGRVVRYASQSAR
jgi:hypothetical protein